MVYITRKLADLDAEHGARALGQARLRLAPDIPFRRRRHRGHDECDILLCQRLAPRVNPCRLVRVAAVGLVRLIEEEADARES